MSATGNQKELFGGRKLWSLLIPLMLEHLLTALMGMVDSVMVSNVGPEAISAVSLVDAINMFVIEVFWGLAVGASVVCAQYLGNGDLRRASKAANQILITVAFLSAVVTAACAVGRERILMLVFGSVDRDVKQAAEIYFAYTTFAYPFTALFHAGAAILRAQEDSRTSMTAAVCSNLMNVAGNAALIWGFHMGIAGAAISTLASRIFACVMVMKFLTSPRQRIRIRLSGNLRPSGRVILLLLTTGIPAAVESGMFQFGKLAVQSVVSTLGTTAIAAQAMTNILENLSGVAGMGAGDGLTTIVGECIGAGRQEEASYYIKKVTLLSEVAVTASCLVMYGLCRCFTRLAGMPEEAAAMCVGMMGVITIVKPLFWTLSFVPAYGLRGAGDGKFTMLVSCGSMWCCRVGLTVLLCRYFGFGPMGVWIGMFTDWAVRGTLFGLRFLSGKWRDQRVIA